jgi:TM2 domain-containing membrane protein YozV
LPQKYFILSLLLFLFKLNAVANNTFVIVNCNGSDSANCGVELTTSISELKCSEKRPHPLVQLLKLKKRKNKKLAAAILAFPFPFGIVGLHRIYLGCAPYVPVVYIASLGGIFGLLPLIDFCVLVSTNDIEKYINNNNVFIWVK